MKTPLFYISLLLVFSIQAQIIRVDDAPYNAVGDGITDDSAAIQQAIYDLKANGGEMQFTSGKTYMISQGLNFYNFPNNLNYLVTTTASDKATIKIQDGAPLNWGHWCFRLSESNNITIKNLIVDGNRDTRNPDAEYSGIDVMFIDGASDGTRFENLVLINSPGDNLYIVVHDGESPMTDFEMHNCRLENAYRNNMSVISGSNFKIIGCEFINANGTAPEAGIDFEPNTDSFPYNNMLVEGCLFKDNHNFGLMLTYIVSNTGTSVIKDNLFDNNGLMIASKNNDIHHNIFVNQDHQHSFGNSTRDGIIYFHTDQTPTDNEVHHNYFYDNNMPAGSHLIHFMYNSGGNNNVHDNYGYGNTVDGFVLDDTNPQTPPQIINNNVFLNHREMAYWNMDSQEISGSTINDLSDFNHSGTITGATTIPGAINEALDFSVDDNYLSIPANTNLNIEMNFTLLAWVKWNGINSETEQIISGRGTDWKLGVSNTGNLFFTANPPYTLGLLQTPDGSIPQNQWKLVAVTYNGRDTKLYIDGLLQSQSQANGALGTTLNTMYIGSESVANHSFNGGIDDVRIYNYSLDQVAIQSIYNSVNLSTLELVSDKNLIIYPNPTNQYIHIRTNLPLSIIEIYNNLGKLLSRKEGNIRKISVEDFKTGIYTIKMISGSYSVAKKIVIQKF